MAKVLLWFYPSWYHYLLEGNTGWRNVWCRLRGHPNGYRYYVSNPEATEPDYRCWDCDEEIN